MFYSGHNPPAQLVQYLQNTKCICQSNPFSDLCVIWIIWKKSEWEWRHSKLVTFLSGVLVGGGGGGGAVVPLSVGQLVDKWASWELLSHSGGTWQAGGSFSSLCSTTRRRSMSSQKTGKLEYYLDCTSWPCWDTSSGEVHECFCLRQIRVTF